MKTVRDIDFAGKKVLMRAVLNLPLKDGVVQDDFRLRKILPTIKYVLENCEQLILIGHGGRPKGKVVPGLSFKPVAERLQELLNQPVVFVPDCMDDVPEEKIVMLENVRFHAEEEANDMAFAERLASHADVYVNEAFPDYRPHASVVLLPQLLPGCVGFEFEKEIEYLSLDDVERPLVALLGGAKLDSKLPLIENLLEKVDYLLLGGAMIFNFYKAQGWEIGGSLVEEDFENAKSLLENPKIVIPKDVVVARNPEVNDAQTVEASEIPEDKMGLDIGEETVKEYKEIMRRAKTIVWNGPMGYYENPIFEKATRNIAEFLAKIPAKTILGGGDTASIIRKMELTDSFTHVSTGGGASLVMLEGNKLPSLKALEENEEKFS